MVFGMALKVFGQLPDPACEKRDLHIGAARILFVELELLHVHRVTAFCHKRAGIVGEESLFASFGSRDLKSGPGFGFTLPIVPKVESLAGTNPVSAADDERE